MGRHLRTRSLFSNYTISAIDILETIADTMKRARGDTPVQQDDVAMDGRRRGAPCAALPARGPANASGIDRPVTDNRTAYWTTIPARRTALQVGAATTMSWLQPARVLLVQSRDQWTPLSLIVEAFIGVL